MNSGVCYTCGHVTDNCMCPFIPTQKPTPAEVLAMIEQAGAKWNGIQRGLVPGQELAVFTDLETCSTICLPLTELTPEAVTAAIARKRAEYTA